jgi:hypothetical protein
VRVEGNVTQYYVPIHAHDRSYIRVVAALDKQTQLIKMLRAEAEAAFDLLCREHWLDDCTTYNAAHAARLKLEDEMKP